MSRLLIGKFHSGSPTGEWRDGDVAHYNGQPASYGSAAWQPQPRSSQHGPILFRRHQADTDAGKRELTPDCIYRKPGRSWWRRAVRYTGEPPVAFIRDILAAAREAGVTDGLYIGCGNGRDYLPLFDHSGQ